MKVIVATMNGNKSVEIEPCSAPFSDKELEKLTKKFNKDVRVIEFVGGSTYCVTIKSYRLKSASVDELMEMYKSAWKGKIPQERKCFFHNLKK